MISLDSTSARDGVKFSMVKQKVEINKIIPVFFLLMISIYLSAQDGTVSDIISSTAEVLAEDETDPEAVTSFIEKLYDLHEKPVRINSGNETEISRLFFLTDFQVKALKDYVSSSGRIYSLYEIANITGFGRELTTLLLPFVILDPEKQEYSDSIRFRNNILSNLSVRYPISEPAAPGSPWKILTRYKFTAGGFTGGITSEKDGGEKLITGKPPLPDFLSGYLCWSGKGLVRKVIAGDFGARFGMGTNINTGLRTGLSLTQTGYLSGNDEIKPYTSADENIFFRGLALQLQLKKTGLCIFYSCKGLDASIDTASDNRGLYVVSFYKSGLHNTLSSIEKKDAITEYSYGVNLTKDLRNIKIGFLFSESRFSIPVNNFDPIPEYLYDFTGYRNSTLSTFYRAVYGKLVFYGEVSSNLNRKSAFVQGFSFRPADRLTMNLIYRNYFPGFTGFHGKGLFSSSSGDNLKGVFGNFTLEAARHLFIIAGCDLRYYPWLKYRCSAPSMGVTREIRIKYLPTDKLTFETVYNNHCSYLNRPEKSGIEKQEEVVNRLIKVAVRYSPVDKLTFCTRFDYKVVQPGSERGMMVLQDINYRFGRIPVSVWFRYCIFNTDGWNSRLYTYENDLVYSFSIPALSGKGNRSYILVAWKAGKFADIRIKYSFSGFAQVKESFKETKELKFQVRMWF